MRWIVASHRGRGAGRERKKAEQKAKGGALHGEGLRGGEGAGARTGRRCVTLLEAGEKALPAGQPAVVDVERHQHAFGTAEDRLAGRYAVVARIETVVT